MAFGGYYWLLPTALNKLQRCSSSTDLPRNDDFYFGGNLGTPVTYVTCAHIGPILLWWALPGWPKNPDYGPGQLSGQAGVQPGHDGPRRGTL